MSSAKPASVRRNRQLEAIDRQNGTVAVGDIGNGPVAQTRRAFQGLHQVRLIASRIINSHRARNAQVAAREGLPLRLVSGNHDAAEAIAHISRLWSGARWP
jgi:hypothetical protein